MLHAHEVFLDSLISQDVVGQDFAAGGEPNVFTPDLLLRVPVDFTGGIVRTHTDRDA